MAEQLMRDVRPLSVLQHPNVVQYFGVMLSPEATDVLLVCEFCSRGSLLDLILHQRRFKGVGNGHAAESKSIGDPLAPERRAYTVRPQSLPWTGVVLSLLSAMNFLLSV